ncbi:MAG: RecJ, partial [uncultured Gemmatimonadaceae bacterium]
DHEPRRSVRRPGSPPGRPRRARGGAHTRHARRALDARERGRRRVRLGDGAGAPPGPARGRRPHRQPHPVAPNVRLPPGRRRRGAERGRRGGARGGRRDPRRGHQRPEAARRARRRGAPSGGAEARHRPPRAERRAARHRRRRRHHRVRDRGARLRPRADARPRDHARGRALDLHRAAHRHRRLPVQQHLAALPRDRRRAPRRRARPRGDVPAGVRQRVAGQAAPAPRRARHARDRRGRRAGVDHRPRGGDGAVRPAERGPRRDRRAPPLDRGDAPRALLPRPGPRQGEGVVPELRHRGRQRLRAAVRRGRAREGVRRAHHRPARRGSRAGGRGGARLSRGRGAGL